MYGAMVAGMDEGIGRVMAKLKEVGVDENTLVIFYSDNGGRLSHAVNLPLRGHKGMLFEGGIRVPFVMSWPAKFPKGNKSESPISALDIFPTVIEAAGVGSDSVEHLDGISLVNSLANGKETPAGKLFWRYAMGDDQFGYATRDGDMKLVQSGYKNRNLLFNLAADPWEQNDLASEQPETVARLAESIKQWDAKNVTPKWLDPHGPNVRKEESKRQKRLSTTRRVANGSDRRKFSRRWSVNSSDTKD